MRQQEPDGSKNILCIHQTRALGYRRRATFDPKDQLQLLTLHQKLTHRCRVMVLFLTKYEKEGEKIFQGQQKTPTCFQFQKEKGNNMYIFLCPRADCFPFLLFFVFRWEQFLELPLKRENCAIDFYQQKKNEKKNGKNMYFPPTILWNYIVHCMLAFHITLWGTCVTT